MALSWLFMNFLAFLASAECGVAVHILPPTTSARSRAARKAIVPREVTRTVVSRRGFGVFMTPILLGIVPRAARRRPSPTRLPAVAPFAVSGHCDPQPP